MDICTICNEILDICNEENCKKCKERGKHEIPCDNCTDELKIQSAIDSRE